MPAVRHAPVVDGGPATFRTAKVRTVRADSTTDGGISSDRRAQDARQTVQQMVCDGQQVIQSGDLCSLSLPTQDEEYRVRHEYDAGVLSRSYFVDPRDGSDIVSVVDQTIDDSTGLPSAVFDVAGVGTSLRYDRMSRLVREVPDESAIVEHVYTFPTLAQPSRANSYKTKACPPGSPSSPVCGDSSALSWEYHEYDGLGRRTTTTARYPSTAGLQTFEDNSGSISR